MSETEHIKGRLVPTGETLEAFMDRLGVSCDDKEDLLDSFYCDYYDSHVIVGGDVYVVAEKYNFQYEDIFEASMDPNGSIDIHLKYYNGGCSFSEAVGYAVENIE